MKILSRAIALSAGIATLSAFGVARARPHDAPSAPPQAALDACSGATEGNVCSMSIEGREVHGLCAPLSGGSLACRPAAPPPPPAEALQACANGTEGNLCQTNIDGWQTQGQCVAIPDYGLACRPAGPTPRF